MTTFAQSDASPVVVIGSGASGGTLANELAQQGIDVVCLEAGPRLETADIVNNEAEMFTKLTWLDERIGEGDAFPPFPMWTCKAVGGTTMHWTAACPRLQPHEMRALSTYGELAEASLVDWPITPEELAPYYDRAEDQLGVTGTHDIDRPAITTIACWKLPRKPSVTKTLTPTTWPSIRLHGTVALGVCSWDSARVVA